MRRLTPLDWVGATVVLGLASMLTAVFFHDGLGAPDGVALSFGFGAFVSGVVAARIWVLRRPAGDEDASARIGLSTGEMTAQRLADMEARIFELEERLDLAERLLVEARDRPRLPQRREVTPV